MPGPSNNKRKGKSRGKNPKRQSGNLPRPLQTQTQYLAVPSNDQHQLSSNDASSEPSSASTPSLKTPSPVTFDFSPHRKELSSLDDDIPRTVEEVMLQEPFIHDPGNGPRVRDARAFMSSFFAKPPAMDDPLSAEFAQEEVLQMLCTILPEETALILWYNKSRAESRVCPACQRLYRLGDLLPDLLNEAPAMDKPTSPQLIREQRMSGLCSPVCFIMASFNYPGAIKSAWGCMADDMDDATWELLNGPGEGVAQNEVSRTLGMLVKMTRLHDLGLAQLCFEPEEAPMLQAGEIENEPEPSSVL
ncbi:hypothetical protein BDZ97DRAFT_1901973 [Flammula alnicola]|nr:hypothetical protein BDZ97DRAFT_1901973 [Flammula alnicola]